MEKRNLRTVGSAYEQLAVDYLRKNGYEILEQNYRIRQSEIDIIAKQEQTVVFVEVKYRKDSGSGYGAEAVTYEKQRRISKAAAHYLTIHRLWERIPCRFDVIAIEGDQIRHIQHAFHYVD